MDKLWVGDGEGEKSFAIDIEGVKEDLVFGGWSDFRS